MDGLEFKRLDAMLEYEREAKALGYRLIAGLDEAGRGPLAGPVVSAAVILPDKYYPEGLDDSKKLTPKTRDRLFAQIVDESVAWAVGTSDSREIDDMNILNATILSMERALNALYLKPDFLLIDALKLKNVDIGQNPIIKGDALSLSIAAASVLAKVTRDRLMSIYDGRYPGYGFTKHKGYGTAEHYKRINELGLCPIHRKSFYHGGERYVQMKLN